MQCGVYKNVGDSESYAPYLLDVQADMLNSLETRIMVPLVRFFVSLRSQVLAQPGPNSDGAREGCIRCSRSAAKNS
jgi:hypothetical protein